MKVILDDVHMKFFIDTKEVIGIKVNKEDYYSNVVVFLRNGKEIELRCDENEAKEVLNKLIGDKDNATL